MKDACIYLRHEAKDYWLAGSLLDEAEKEAHLLDARFRADELEGIARLKRGMKQIDLGEIQKSKPSP